MERSGWYTWGVGVVDNVWEVCQVGEVQERGGGAGAGDNGGAGGEQKQSRVEAAERLARAAKPGHDELVGCIGVL